MQVKSCIAFASSGRWSVTVCDPRRNQSWNGVAKCLDPSRFDYLFVLVGDGRRWFIPADRIEAVRGLRLGGPKYAEFEVERRRADPRLRRRRAASTIAS